MIHDEAALASTREQHQLLNAIQASGARLIEVGDPRQSQAVGAGGLWPHLTATACANQTHVELTHNVRASDPADRRDQQLLRGGHYEQAVRDYHRRGRIQLVREQSHAEDGALEAAQADREAGKRTLVIAQTSNERLDELNARAQAIRAEHGELGDQDLPVTGRPYELHAGDHIQIRHTIHHSDAGAIRNGTTGQITNIDRERQVATIVLSDERAVTLERQEIDAAEMRLAYVQHPFPAQGLTSDTTHLIVAEHATRDGSYVALTRARERSHIHAGLDQLDAENEDPLLTLAETIARSEPEIPSIQTPLAHETMILEQHSHEQHQEIRPSAERLEPQRDRQQIEPNRDRREVPARSLNGVEHQHVIAILGPRPQDTPRTPRPGNTPSSRSSATALGIRSTPTTSYCLDPNPRPTHFNSTSTDARPRRPYSTRSTSSTDLAFTAERSTIERSSLMDSSATGHTWTEALTAGNRETTDTHAPRNPSDAPERPVSARDQPFPSTDARAKLSGSARV